MVVFLALANAAQTHALVAEPGGACGRSNNGATCPPGQTCQYDGPLWLCKTDNRGCAAGAEGINLLSCYTLGIFNRGTVASAFSTPAQMVNLIVSNLFIIAGLIFLVMIIYSGFLFINDTTKGKDEAVNVLVTATKGLIVMFVAYWIVQIAEIITGASILF